MENIGDLFTDFCWVVSGRPHRLAWPPCLRVDSLYLTWYIGPFDQPGLYEQGRFHGEWYLVSNDLGWRWRLQDDLQKKWRSVEEYHKGLKQNASVSRLPQASSGRSRVTSSFPYWSKWSSKSLGWRTIPTILPWRSRYTWPPSRRHIGNWNGSKV